MSESETVPESVATDGIETETLFSLLGRAHSLEVLHAVVLAEREPLRFGELQERLDVSPNTLSRRLEELVEAGFLQRTQYDEIPPRVEYEATEQLVALRPVFRELESWLERYGADSMCPADE